MIVESIYFCVGCNHQHDISDMECDSCHMSLHTLKGRNITKLNVGVWWKFWDKKYICFFVPEDEFKSQLEFLSWKSEKSREYLSGNHEHVYHGKNKYI